MPEHLEVLAPRSCCNTCNTLNEQYCIQHSPRRAVMYDLGLKLVKKKIYIYL